MAFEISVDLTGLAYFDKIKRKLVGIKDRLTQASIDQRIDFYESVADAVAQGIPQYDVLQTLEREFTKLKHPLARVLRSVIARIRGAEAGSGAVQKTVGTELIGLLPYDEVALDCIRGSVRGLSEKGGENAANFARMNREMKSKIFAALAKPVFYLLAFLGLLVFFSVRSSLNLRKASPKSFGRRMRRSLALFQTMFFDCCVDCRHFGCWLSCGFLCSITSGSGQ